MLHGERFGKFTVIKIKIKIFMYNTKGPFKVENPISYKTYKVNQTCL